MQSKARKGANKGTPKVSSRSAPKARSRGGRSGRNIGQSRSGPVSSSAPSTIGIAIPSAYFRFDGKAQALTDIGGMGDSTRVVGCDLFDTPITAGSSSHNAGFGGTGTYWSLLAPGEMSPRLTQLEELFQFYAIRKLRVIYSPEVPTSTAGSLALALVQEADEQIVITTPTQQELLEVTPAMKMPVWMTGAFEYKHTGTRLWSTQEAGGGSESGFGFYQGVLGCTLTGGVASTQYGPSRLRFKRAPRAKLLLAKISAKQSAEEFKDSSLGLATEPLELKKKPSYKEALLGGDYHITASTPRVPSDERKSEREASVERKPVVSGGPSKGLFR